MLLFLQVGLSLSFVHDITLPRLSLSLVALLDVTPLNLGISLVLALPNLALLNSFSALFESSWVLNVQLSLAGFNVN